MRRKPGDPVHVKPVAVLEGHQGLVLSVSGSEDGKALLSGGMDRTARLWELPEKLPKMGEKPLVMQKEKKSYPVYGNGVEAIAISPDGKHVVSGAYGGILHMRTADGVNEFTARFNGGVMCAVFSRDGKYLAVGAGYNPNPTVKEVRVWDVAEKREIAKREDFGEGVKGLEFTPDGKTLIVAVADQTVHVWPWAEPKDQQTLTPPSPGFTPQPFLAGAVSPDGALLAFSGESQTVFVYDRKQSKIAAELTGHEDVVAGMAFSPDGKTLATASYDKTIKLWNTDTWKEKKTLKGHKGWVFAVAFSPDGKTLASGSYDKSVRLWNVETGAEKRSTTSIRPASARSPFRRTARNSSRRGRTAVPRVWNVADGKMLLGAQGSQEGSARGRVHAGRQVDRQRLGRPDGEALGRGDRKREALLPVPARTW